MSKLNTRLNKLESKAEKDRPSFMVVCTKKGNHYVKLGGTEIVPDEMALSDQSIIIEFVSP